MRGRIILSLLSSAAFVVGAVAVLTGRTTLAAVGVVVGFSLLLLGRALRPPAVPAPTLSPDEADAVREVRHRDGEPAAVTRLRQDHPGLGLLDAVRSVRARSDTCRETPQDRHDRDS